MPTFARRALTTSSAIRCTQRTWRTRSTSSNYSGSEGIWCVPINPDTKLSRSREMAEMSLVEKMSYLQFQMHFDESIQSKPTV